MKHQFDKKQSYMDAAFFRFTWKLLLKKTSLYIAIIAYFILVLTFSLIVPQLSGSNPIVIISNPIMSMFLLFGMAVVSCFIAVEIFRTSIDDGTELLVVSKPLSRREIVFVKLTVFIVSILIVSLISAAIGTTSFISTNSYLYDNINIVIGLFLGSFIVGIIFGSLATIISIFAKKVIAMLLTIAIAFALMVWSLLSSFVIDNPVNILTKNSESIAPVSVVNFDTEKDSKNMTLTQGVISSTEDGRTPEQVWNDAKSKSSYKIAGMIDIGAQLGSIFSLTTPPKDSMQALANLSAFNSPIDMSFSKYDLDTDTQQGITLKLPQVNIDGLNNEQNQIPQETKDFINLYNLYGRDVTKLVAITNSSSSIRTAKNAYWNSSLDYSYSDFIKTDINSELWEETWNYLIPVYKVDSNGKETTDKYTLGEWVDQQVSNALTIYHEANNSNPSNTSYSDKSFDWLPDYFESERSKNNSEVISNYIKSKKTIDSITKPSTFFVEGYAKYVYDNGYGLNASNASGFVRSLNNVIFSAYYEYSHFNTTQLDESEEIDIMNIFDIKNDIDEEVTLEQILPTQAELGDNKDEYNNLANGIAAAYKAATKEELTKDKTLSHVIEKLCEDQNFSDFLKRKSATRNKYRTMLELNGITFPQILNKNNLKLSNYIDFSQPLPKTEDDMQSFDYWSKIIDFSEGAQSLAKDLKNINFKYYVGSNEDYIKFNSLTDYSEYTKELNNNYWSFSFYPSLKLAPIQSLSSFQQIYSYSLINRYILIPVWVSIAIVMFIVGMVLYSRRDFA